MGAIGWAVAFCVASIALSLMGHPEVGLFLAVVAAGLFLAAPSSERRDARRRNRH